MEPAEKATVSGVKRTHTVHWGRPGQRPITDTCLRRGAYDQCIEFLRKNWDNLQRTQLAQAGYEPVILNATGGQCSYVF